MRKMKSEGDEKGGVEGEFRTTQTPFEAFAVLTPTFITTDYTDSHTTFLWKIKLDQRKWFLIKLFLKSFSVNLVKSCGFLWSYTNTEGERSWRRRKVNEKN